MNCSAVASMFWVVYAKFYSDHTFIKVRQHHRQFTGWK
jgi:hypothetical protein